MARTPRLFAAATRLGLRTPLFVSPINRIVSFLPREDWIIVGWVLAIKILLFLIAVKSHTMLWDEWVTSPYQWFQTWDQWDFGYYQEIAEFGYNKTDGSIAFYPLFPGLIRLVAYFSGNYLAAGLIVSGIACVVAAILLRRLVQLDYPVSVAMSSVWFFLIFPTTYFLHVGYTESLFLALALGCVLAARVDRWRLAGLLGAFCWMTRAGGAILVPALAIEATQQYWARPRWNWRWLSIAIVPTGFAVYLLINWRVSGDPFAFLQARKISFQQSFALPWVGIRRAPCSRFLCSSVFLAGTAFVPGSSRSGRSGSSHCSLFYSLAGSGRSEACLWSSKCERALITFHEITI